MFLSFWFPSLLCCVPMVHVPVLLVAMFVSCWAAAGLAQFTDPGCPVFTVRDPDTLKTYTYDIARFKVSNNDSSRFVAGSEYNLPVTAFVNICGDARVVGCASSTPICEQARFDTPSQYFSFGTPSSWQMEPYYYPVDGPGGQKIYDGGLVVTIGNGDVCSANGVARNSKLWLRCDPLAVDRPTQVRFGEFDPSNPNVPSVCSYFFEPISHAFFCPLGTSTTTPSSTGLPLSDVFAIVGTVIGVVIVGLLVVVVVLLLRRRRGYVPLQDPVNA